jgi:HEAT repeat protein
MVRLAALLLVLVIGRPPIAAAQTPSPADRAWEVLRAGLTSEKDNQRAVSVSVLGLLEKDPTAAKFALIALGDKSPDVRAAAADALGQMHARQAARRLITTARKETHVQVVMACARATIALGDPAGYGVYYAILTGEKKAGGSLLESQKKMLKDPKKMAEFGFEQGIGFIPFAGLGYGAIKAITHDDASPVRAAAARILAKDRDPGTRDALVAASADKSWIVRAAALDALSRRGDPSVLEEIAPRLEDEEHAVRYAAAAATIHLSTLERGKTR